MDNKFNKCLYCGESTVLKCLDCGNYYCNNTSGNISHSVYHCVKNRHKRLSSNFNEIKCSKCTENNVFKLGVDGYDYNNPICVGCGDLPLIIQNRKFVFMNSKESSVSRSEIESMEPSLKSLKTTYNSYSEYVEAYLPLISLESKKEKEIKESMKQENVTLRFDGDYVYFYYKRMNSDLKINIGDEIRFTHKYGYSFSGHVSEDHFSEELKVKIENNEYPKIGWTVEYVWRGICYERMIWALKKIEKDEKKHGIFNVILKGGREYQKLYDDEKLSDKKILTPNGIELNDSQKVAVKAALARPLTLIQGPPGTGKTLVSSVIVYNLVKKFKKKVLVVAPSNIAVDQLSIRIAETGVKVLRVMSKKREYSASEASHLSLHVLLKEFEDKELAKSELLKAADVICCTCVTAGQKLFNNFRFPYVLIDEAVQATEPLTLIPMCYGCNKIILVGDHKQLGPTVLDKDVAHTGFKKSLFERLMNIKIFPYMLNTQYRMHSSLAEFPSEHFYDNLLISCTQKTKVLKFPNNFFYASLGKEEISPSGTSFVNKEEAVIVEHIIRYLFMNDVTESQIGVITPYEGQRSYILSRVFGNEIGNLEIENVDGFQGREKDFIIVSLVRSNNYQGIGFVADLRRMNVTLTRAKHVLIIVGNPYTLKKDPMWGKLLEYYNFKGDIYDGPIENLRGRTL